MCDKEKAMKVGTYGEDMYDAFTVPQTAKFMGQGYEIDRLVGQYKI